MTSMARVHVTLFCMMMVWGLNLSAVKVLTESLDVMLVASIRMVMATAEMMLVGWYLQPSGLGAGRDGIAEADVHRDRDARAGQCRGGAQA